MTNGFAITEKHRCRYSAAAPHLYDIDCEPSLLALSKQMRMFETFRLL